MTEAPAGQAKELAAQAKALAAEGNWSEVVGVLNQLSAIRPDDASLWYNKAVAHQRLNQLEDAQISAQKCLELKPDHPRAGALLEALRAAQERTAEEGDLFAEDLDDGPAEAAPPTTPTPAAPAKATTPREAPKAVSEITLPKFDAKTSLSTAWRLYTSNLGPLFALPWRALGPMFSGKLWQILLAFMDFVLKATAGDKQPDRNWDRLINVSNEHVESVLGFKPKGVGAILGDVLKGMVLGGLTFGALFLLSFGVGLLATLIPFANFLVWGLGFFAAFGASMAVYFWCLADFFLGLGLMLRFSGLVPPEELQQQVPALIKDRKSAFAGFCGVATMISECGVVLCGIGVLLTSPFIGGALYVGLADATGVEQCDVDRFLPADEPAVPTANG